MTENAPDPGPRGAAFGHVSSVPPQIGPYRIVRLLGKGAQGFVYLAEDAPLRRLVALKVLVPGLITDPVAIMRFQREAEITSKLDHPGICPVYATGEDVGSFWIAMRYVEGESLAKRILTAREARSSGPTGGRSSNWQRTDFAD